MLGGRRARPHSSDVSMCVSIISSFPTQGCLSPLTPSPKVIIVENVKFRNGMVFWAEQKTEYPHPEGISFEEIPSGRQLNTLRVLHLTQAIIELSQLSTAQIRRSVGENPGRGGTHMTPGETKGASPCSLTQRQENCSVQQNMERSQGTLPSVRRGPRQALTPTWMPLHQISLRHILFVRQRTNLCT